MRAVSSTRGARFIGGAALLLGTTMMTACVPPGIACPAIGYVYTAPVIVEIGAGLDDGGIVAACLGEECEPAAIARNQDGVWEVPQEPPYTSAETTGLSPGDGIHIVITTGSGEVVRDEWVEVPYTGSGGFCPGPVEFQPVVIS